MELKSRCLVQTLCGFKGTLSELLLVPLFSGPCASLSEPEREPGDPDNMLSNALNVVRRQAIPPVEKASKVRDPARGVRGPPLDYGRPVLRINNSPHNTDGSYRRVRGREYAGFRVCVSTPRSMALLDGAGLVPSDQVGRLSNNTSELHAVTVGLLWIARNARQGGEVVLVCHDSEHARHMACGLWKPRANWKAVSKAKSACSLAEAQCTPQWVHVDSHTGDERNERADGLAALGGNDWTKALDDLPRGVSRPARRPRRYLAPGLQRAGDPRSAVHVVAFGAPGADTSVHLDRWGAALRSLLPEMRGRLTSPLLNTADGLGE